MSVETYAPLRYITIAGKDLPKDISDDVISFSYEDIDDKMDELRLTILDKTGAHIDDPLLQEGNEIKARWGYLGNLSDTKTCTIKEIDYDFSGGETVISLVAYDKGHKLTGRAARTCWKGKPVSEVVKEIADKHGLKSEVDVPDDAARESISQGGKNDMEFLRELATESGCVMKVRNDTLTFLPEREHDPIVAFEYNREQDGYLKFMRIDSDSEKGKGAAAETEVSGVDPLTGKPFKETGKAADSKYVMKLAGQAGVHETPPQEKHDETGKVAATTVQDAKTAKSAAKTTAANAVKSAISASAEIIGLPYLASQTTITITGIGKKFSGNWKVKSVTHKIDSGGYVCSLDLTKADIGKTSSSGSKKQGSDKAAKSAGKTEKGTVTINLAEKRKSERNGA
jgi:phage protein D